MSLLLIALVSFHLSASAEERQANELTSHDNMELICASEPERKQALEYLRKSMGKDKFSGFKDPANRAEAVIRELESALKASVGNSGMASRAANASNFRESIESLISRQFAHRIQSATTSINAPGEKRFNLMGGDKDAKTVIVLKRSPRGALEIHVESSKAMRPGTFGGKAMTGAYVADRLLELLPEVSVGPTYPTPRFHQYRVEAALWEGEKRREPSFKLQQSFTKNEFDPGYTAQLPRPSENEKYCARYQAEREPGEARNGPGAWDQARGLASRTKESLPTAVEGRDEGSGASSRSGSARFGD